MNRKEEVRHLLSLSIDELISASAGQLKITETLDELYEFLAEEMVAEFRKAAKGDRVVNFIMPVGPPQPYRIMAEKINYKNLSLKNVRFFFMDEYIDSTRHRGVGGNLENFPKRAITLGMKQCLGARKMLLMTRNESTEFLWANTIIRIAAAGQPGDDYPVTYCCNHKACVIASDRATATAPKFNI